ncbi:MAG: hypothetical protein MZW92_78010 [Comamonadaceae bacterium]|nr:hypothetical protein [Comamonadaceae bacterium]
MDRQHPRDLFDVMQLVRPRRHRAGDPARLRRSTWRASNRPDPRGSVRATGRDITAGLPAHVPGHDGGAGAARMRCSQRARAHGARSAEHGPGRRTSGSSC